MSTISSDLDNILSNAIVRKKLSSSDIIYLLSLQERPDLELLFETARKMRQEFFQDKVFLYGFLYFSTWCRNDCTFCYYRRSNEESKRYRKSIGEIIEATGQLAESGVHLLDLTLGEDPFFYHQENGFANLAHLIKEVKDTTSLPVMVSPGVISRDGANYLSAAGADWYACYQETHNRELFNRLRWDQSYDIRIAGKIWAQKAGLLVEEGIMVGIGESLDDIAVSVQNMDSLGAQQVRVMSFVPQAGTPMVTWPTPSRKRELAVIAVLRLMFPDRLIPASLDIDGVEGLQERINAGANVITSLIPPQLGLAGVAQNSKDINEGHRTISGILPILDKMGLKAASRGEYRNWVDEKKRILRKSQIG